MVGTIIPMVHGKRLVQKIPTELLAHSAGCVLGGAALGLVAGTLRIALSRQGVISLRVGLLAVAIVSIAYAFQQAGLWRLPVMQSTWQVPRRWTQKGSVICSWLYGLCLGCGVTVRLNSCLYPVLTWLILDGSMGEDIGAMCIYGAARSIPVWIAHFTYEHHGNDPAALCFGLTQWQGAMGLMSSLVLSSLGGCCLALAR